MAAAQPASGSAEKKATDSLRRVSRAEVAKHNKDGDLWIIVDSDVYNLSTFASAHPGGETVLLDANIAGKDSTKAFFSLHRSAVLNKYKRLRIARIEKEEPRLILPQIGAISKVPYAESSYLRDDTKTNPYYKASHIKLAKAARAFFDEYVAPEAAEHELSGERPTVELIKRMGKAGINHMRLGPGKHLHGVTCLGIPGEEIDFFHEAILSGEIARTGARGYFDGLNAGMWIGLTPIMSASRHPLALLTLQTSASATPPDRSNLRSGSDKLKRDIMPPVLAGEKFIALAITDPFAGSDVQGMQATAKKTEDGKHFIVNGTKKWITNGTFADYFSVGVRTSEKALSMLFIPRGEGVETKPIKTSYSPAAGTAYVTFDNVKVPVENLLGAENKGLAVILSNFNHERWNMTIITVRWCRFVTEEAFKWAHQREVFGKALIQQPVIRAKFADCFALIESHQAWLDQITANMNAMTYAEMSDNLAGPIALAKRSATRMAQQISDHLVQIFGGRGITKGGMGGNIEVFQRSFKFDAILGGSEEVLGDLGVRQAMRKMPPAML